MEKHCKYCLNELVPVMEGVPIEICPWCGSRTDDQETNIAKHFGISIVPSADARDSSNPFWKNRGMIMSVGEIVDEINKTKEEIEKLASAQRGHLADSVNPDLPKKAQYDARQLARKSQIAICTANVRIDELRDRLMAIYSREARTDSLCVRGHDWVFKEMAFPGDTRVEICIKCGITRKVQPTPRRRGK